MKHAPVWLPLIIVATKGLSAQTTSAPAVQSILLSPNTTIDQQLAGGQSHEYLFRLQTGEYARIRVEQRTVNLAIACFRPDGTEVLAADSYPIGDAEDAELIGDVTGTYRLRLLASEPGAPMGRYAVTLRDIGTATARQTERIAAGRAFAKAIDSYRQGSREAMIQSIAQLSEAMTHWRAAGDQVEVAKALYTSGMAYIEIGDQQKGLDYGTQALAAAEAAGDRKTEARALNTIGEVHNYFGDKRKAIGYYEQALPLMRAAGDRAGEGNALNNLAVAYAHTGEKLKAVALFGQAEKIFRDLQDRRMIAEVAGNVGVTYDNLGEYQKALESHQSDLALKRELQERASQGIALNNIGTAYSGLEEYQKALDAYAAALEINRELDNRRNVAINLNNAAWVYNKLADRRRALSFYQESLAVVRQMNDRHTTAVTLNNIAEIHADLGDYRKALEIHTEALALRRATGHIDGEANTLNHLGTALFKLGQRDKAREHFERALEIYRKSANPYMLASTLNNLGALHRETGDTQQALAHLNEALGISRTIYDRSGAAAALAELARVERDRGDFTRARQLAGEALAALESVRLAVVSPALRASFFASVRDVQEFEIDILMRLHAERPGDGFAAAALFASERSRARSLLELLHESGAEIRRGVDTALIEREREIERLLSRKAEQQRRLLSGKNSGPENTAVAKELDALATELEQVQSRIRTTSPQYAALTQPAPLELRDIQTKVLDENTILLEYSLGAEKSFVWAVTPTSMEVFELPPRAEIESAARRVYELLTARNRKPAKETPAARSYRIRQADAAYLSAAAMASRMLLGPISSRMGNKRLLIVGEGVLQYLPFAALPEPGIGAQKTAAPLVANHEIISAPSASVTEVLRREMAGRKPAEKALAILADPVFHADDPRVAPRNLKASSPAGADLAGEDFVRLRFSRNEADEIARLAPAGATRKALDFDASRDTVMDPDFGSYRIVHFATHSFLHNEHPELSGVVLSLFDSSGRPRNGFLRLYDIYNLRLGADLVVLSACQTALGGEIKGEGLVGLTRAFLYAGAPRVVASLWEVDDRTTAELMRRFYEGMLGRGETPAAALRATQVAFWKTRGWDAPYYWAAFTLQGEWR